MKSVDVPDGVCPACDYRFNGAAEIRNEGVTPRPGDLSVCINCAAPLAYKDDLTMRELTDSEIRRLDDETKMDLYRARASIRELNRKFKRRSGR